MDTEVATVDVAVPRVAEGDWVLIVDNETKFSFAYATRTATVKMGKKPIKCEALIGAAYGSFFDVINGKLIPTNPNAHKEALEDLVGDETSGTAANDNRHLTDYNNTQGMTQAEVKELKEAGQKTELVRKLAENSASWNKRTEYSQQKYILKKSQKHQILVQVVRPTAALITKAYFAKKAFRTLHMRPDTIAHIMSLSNLQSGLRTLIIDDCIGLILGTALERANGRGAVYNLHQGNDCNPSALRLFNFTSEQIAPLKHVPIELLRGTLSAQTYKVEEDDENTASTSAAETMDQEVADADNGDMDDAEEKPVKQNEKKRIDPSSLPPKRKKRDVLPYAKVLEQDAKDGITPEQQAERRRKNQETRRLYRELKWQNLSETKNELETRGVDSIIIAGPPHPLQAINSVWRFLNLSGHFVIYSEFIQPLVECYEALYQAGCVVNLRLTETWCRTYQVLPKRTHPLNNMSSSSGFLLSGIRVEAVDRTVQRGNQAAQAQQKSKTANADASSSREDDEPAAKRAKLTESS